MSTLIELNQMNSHKIMDGRVAFAVVIYPFYENILIKR